MRERRKTAKKCSGRWPRPTAHRGRIVAPLFLLFLIDFDMLMGEAIADMFGRGPVVIPPLIPIRAGRPLLRRHHLLT